ncbi:hypothetical protein ACS127_03550 [Amphibacillus sp. Q70]|uniref:hypothetical protein n=1 Tax=Amphibacillus sp. Q70 TaxID=3453416 RepID=UPI003F87D3DD
MFKITHVQQTSSFSFKNVIDKNIPNKNKFNTQGATVTISEESQNKYIQSLKFKETNKDDVMLKQFRKFYEEYHSDEAIEKRKLEQLEKEQAYNRLEDEFSLSVEYHFPENTLHQTIKETLEGKVVNASLYAAELASAIRSSLSMPDKNAEERAAYREMALKQAEHIAEHYFANEQEATSFMNEINKYYENDVLREKGYVVFDNSDLKPFKNYSSPLSNGKDVSFYTLAKRYMDEEYFERFIKGEGTPKESARFLMQIKNNKEKYRKEIIEEFELNEQQAEEQITATKAMFESFVWENGLVTETMEEQPTYLVEILKWNKDMLNLFN